MSTVQPNHYQILGVRIDALTMKEAATQIVERAADHDGSAVYVVKPYVEFLAAAHRDTSVATILNASWLSLPDGVSTQWAATYLYDGRPSWLRVMGLGVSIVGNRRAITTRLPEKFGGTRFTWKLLEHATKHKLRVYLVGSPQGGDIRTTAKAITARLPKLAVVGNWPGTLGGIHGEKLRQALASTPVEAELLADIQAHRPDLILIGMGFPLQEELMAKLTPQLKHGVLIGEGGTFDYTSFGGRRRKAPGLVQAIGLEWLWRLLLEPRRLRRQLAIPRFILAVYRSSKTK